MPGTGTTGDHQFVMDKERFTDKVAIVTGAARGIGRATALRLASEGASVFVCDVDQAGIDETKSLAREAGGVAEGGSFDISSQSACERSVAECLERFHRLDVLCNMAGILLFEHSHQSVLERWQKVLDVNLTGTFLMIRNALPQLLEGDGGAIVNTASSASLAALPYGAAYSASKGGVLALTRSIAIEYVKSGKLRCNCVCPAGINTQMTTGARPEPSMDQALMGGNSIGYLYTDAGIPIFGEPEEVASVVAMLASDDASYINGEFVRVDGGALA